MCVHVHVEPWHTGGEQFFHSWFHRDGDEEDILISSQSDVD